MNQQFWMHWPRFSSPRARTAHSSRPIVGHQSSFRRPWSACGRNGHGGLMSTSPRPSLPSRPTGPGKPMLRAPSNPNAPRPHAAGPGCSGSPGPHPGSDCKIDHLASGRRLWSRQASRSSFRRRIEAPLPTASSRRPKSPDTPWPRPEHDALSLRRPSASRYLGSLIGSMSTDKP